MLAIGLNMFHYSFSLDSSLDHPAKFAGLPNSLLHMSWQGFREQQGKVLDPILAGGPNASIRQKKSTNNAEKAMLFALSKNEITTYLKQIQGLFVRWLALNSDT